MNHNPLYRLAEYGQSLWYDNITRSMLSNGELDRMIEQDGLKGITSNPSIFEKAIGQGNDYDAVFDQLKQSSARASSEEIFFELAIEDIRAAALKFRSVYEQSQGLDGMVSLEVSPHLAHDIKGTVAQARLLHERLALPNIMIKVPATAAGVDAIRQLTALGINVNATLLFSIERYREVAQAYIKGLRQRLEEGKPISSISSVASFFISRVDAKIDKQIVASSHPGARELKGKIAIANAKLAYAESKKLFAAEFADLRSAGAKPQRLLWASTGTKDKEYSEVLYIDELIGADTVTTIPPKTYDAFRECGKLNSSLEQGWEEAQMLVDRLTEYGIDLDHVTQELEQQGVEAFAKSYDALLNAIENKLEQIQKVS